MGRRKKSAKAAGPQPLSDYDRYAGKLVAEKIEVLKLLRALDYVGADPRECPPLGVALVRLAEFDQMLTGLLESLDRDGRETGSGPVGEFDEFIALGEAVRADVHAVLPQGLQPAVEDALTRVAASPPEIWMEVEALRRLPPMEEQDAEEPLPMTPEEAERVAGDLFTSDTEERIRREMFAEADRVELQERKPLPRSERIEPWLARLPAHWLRTTARCYDLEPTARKERLVAGIAEALRDPETLRMVLRERLGEDEREALADLIAGGCLYAEDDEDIEGCFWVPWRWEGGAAPPGGRLRQHGLAFLGTRRGDRVVDLPAETAELAADALDEIDPELLAGEALI